MAKTAATAMPAVETWLPLSDADDDGVPVGTDTGLAGADVVLVVIVERELVPKFGEPEEDVGLELVISVEAAEEPEVMAESADSDVEDAAGFTEDVAVAEVVEGPDEVVASTLPVTVACSSVELVVSPITLSNWLLTLLAMLLMLAIKSRRCKAILIARAVCDRRRIFIRREQFFL